jgi:serine/tyrosine/threonine adenylyltransferase
VRLSHGHIRFGTFQRLAQIGAEQEMAQLVGYCLTTFPGQDRTGATGNPAALLLNQVVERMADLAASYMVAGFVHGVLNTDNMNISGESFDYGPWRWLPKWDPAFTAAYFDHSGLYAYGRQPEAIHWNCGQLAVALRTLSEAPPLVAALERFPALYREAMARRWCWRLGVMPRGPDEDSTMIGACEADMVASGQGPDGFFFTHRGGRRATGALAEALAPYSTVTDDHSFWSDPAPQSMLIDEVEDIWAAIDSAEDWAPLHAKIAALRRMGDALAPAPIAQGHVANSQDFLI